MSKRAAPITSGLNSGTPANPRDAPRAPWAMRAMLVKNRQSPANQGRIPDHRRPIPSHRVKSAPGALLLHHENHSNENGNHSTPCLAHQ